MDVMNATTAYYRVWSNVFLLPAGYRMLERLPVAVLHYR
jgi:hypothetical protein